VSLEDGWTSKKKKMARFVGLVAVLALVSPAAAFLLGGPVTSVGLRHGAGMSCIQQPRGAMSLRGARRMGMGGLRMIDADGMNQKEEEEAPVTTLSEDDLDARIAALGLGGENGVEDKSTGERSSLSLSLSLLALSLSLSLSLSSRSISLSFLHAHSHFLLAHFVLSQIRIRARRDPPHAARVAIIIVVIIIIIIIIITGPLESRELVANAMHISPRAFEGK
jgi:hypothetical protein